MDFPILEYGKIVWIGGAILAITFLIFCFWFVAKPRLSTEKWQCDDDVVDRINVFMFVSVLWISGGIAVLFWNHVNGFAWLVSMAVLTAISGFVMQHCYTTAYGWRWVWAMATRPTQRFPISTVSTTRKRI